MIFVLDLLKDGALPAVYIIAAEGVDDAARFARRDKSRLQILRIRVVAVEVIDGALVAQRLAPFLAQDRNGVRCVCDLETNSRRKAFPQPSQGTRVGGSEDQVDPAGTGQLRHAEDKGHGGLPVGGEQPLVFRDHDHAVPEAAAELVVLENVAAAGIVNNARPPVDLPAHLREHRHRLADGPDHMAVGEIGVAVESEVPRGAQEQLDLIAEKWGWDQPPVQRYLNWIGGVLTGDWGVSVIYHRPVLDVVGERFLTSLALMGTAWILSGVLGFVLGIVCGLRQNSWADRIIKGSRDVIVKMNL